MKKAWSNYSEDLLTEDDTPQMATRYEQRQRHCLHNQHHRKYRNTTSHACHAEVGVQYMYKQKGRQANHPNQTSRPPILQVDFTYITSFGDKFPTPILTAIDIQTGMAMAAMITDKHNQSSYAKTCLQAFLLECGRTKGILQATMRST